MTSRGASAATLTLHQTIHMNITIKFTSPDGASMEVLIPIPLNAQNLAVSTPSAPETPESTQAASETAFPAAGEEDDGLHDYEILHGDLLPGKKRYASVQDMIEGKEIVRTKVTEKIEEGEVGGEEGGCKGEEGGKEGKRKEKPDPELLELQREAELNALDFSRDLCEIEFSTQQGAYLPEPSHVHDLIKIHGDEFVRRELMKAKTWLDANPHKAKTVRGMKNYINKWMNRAAETLAFLQMKAIAAPAKPAPRREPGNLLAGGSSQEGW